MQQDAIYDFRMRTSLRSHLKGLIRGLELQIIGGNYVKLLLDEMYTGLKEYFETLGYEVVTAQEAGLKAAKDRDVVEYAGKHGLILVTQDQKPAELAELTGVKYILISNAMIAKIAAAKIKEKYPA